VRISSLRFSVVLRAWCPRRARLTPQRTTAHTPDPIARVMRRGLSLSRRSATRELSDAYATGPDRRLLGSGPATLMGFVDPSQCSPSARPGVCDTRPRPLAPSVWPCRFNGTGRHMQAPFAVCLHRSSPHAVIECTPRPADFYGCRSRGSLETPSKQLQKRPTCGRDSTGSWVLLSRTSRAGHALPCSGETRAPTNPAMGLCGVFSRACRVLFHSTPPQGPAGLVRGPPFTAAAFIPAAIRSWVLRATGSRTCIKAEESVTQTGPIDLFYWPARHTHCFVCPLAMRETSTRVRNRNLRPVTSLPSPPLQRFGANSA
jgi:hypothetical protein